jgi:uncharacterized small protein (DUF1192 family)
VVRFILGIVPPANLDGLSHAELKNLNLVVRLFERVAEQHRMIAALRDEIARLNGGLKPSGMEKATEPDKPADQGDSKCGSTKSKLTIHEEIFISKRQVVRLLNTGHDDFLAEAGEVLRAEPSSAHWITVDDRGAPPRAHPVLIAPDAALWGSVKAHGASSPIP